MSGLRGHAGTDGDDAGRCAECNAAEPVGPCAACESMICADCGVFSRDPGGRRVICISCASLIADVSAHRERRWQGLRGRRGEPSGAMVLLAVAVAIAFAAVALSLLATCASPSHAPADNARQDRAQTGDDEREAASDHAAVNPEPRPAATRPPDPPPPAGPLAFRAVEPPAGTGGLPAGTRGAVVAARVFALADSQLHYLYGKRTFAQSPFADRMAFEVAVRPAALDDGSDLLLAAFLAEYRARYANHSLVFLGDAADLSCTHELDAFGDVVRRAGVAELLAVTSNHDGFFVGNFTSRADLDGRLAATDMPHDWTRACSLPGQRGDYRLTRRRAVARLAAMLPAAPANPEASDASADAGDWATSARHDGADAPSAYRGAHLYYVRPLGGGDAAADDDEAPAVWGVFLDTVDYRGFDLEDSRGAGSVGSVSREQLRFLDRAMSDARAVSGTRTLAFVAFGHHPLRAFHRDARRRMLHFLDVHPQIVGYVAAHTHRDEERTVALPGGRSIPELVVGSTTDAPQSARILWVEAAPAPRSPRSRRARRGARKAYRSALASRRLRLDASALCGAIAELARDATGHTGYRLPRDDAPDLNLGLLEQLEFGPGLSKPGRERVVQGLGALAVENELVRSLARLYAQAPVDLAPADRQALADIARRRFAAGDALADVTPYLQGQAEVAPTEYDDWHDPVTRPVLAVAEQGVHRFGPHAALFTRARQARTRSPAAERYFLCHAVHAAAAEARRPGREGAVDDIE